jgi:hypothetical protein
MDVDEIEWWEFDTAREMAEQAAGDIGFVIESAIEAHKGARIALPGGSTSDLIFAQLAESKAIDWSKVTIMPTDDRLVPLGDPLSNYRKLEGYFAARGADLVSLVDETALADRQEAGRLADARLSLLGWPLDLACLGLGADRRRRQARSDAGDRAGGASDPHRSGADHRPGDHDRHRRRGEEGDARTGDQGRPALLGTHRPAPRRDRFPDRHLLERGRLGEMAKTMRNRSG